MGSWVHTGTFKQRAPSNRLGSNPGVVPDTLEEMVLNDLGPVMDLVAAAEPIGTPLPLVYGAMFAFLSQLSSIGKGMQKVGVQNLPELSLRWAVVRQYLHQPTW